VRECLEPSFSLKTLKSTYVVVKMVLWACSPKRGNIRRFTVTVRVSRISTVIVSRVSVGIEVSVRIRLV